MSLKENKKLKDRTKKIYFWIESKLPYFVTLRTRLKRADQMQIVPDDTTVQKSIAVVIQGPILKTEDFTLETVLLYKKIFAGAHIIVSTWDTEETTYLEKIEAAGAFILKNKKPTSTGTQNMNLQIASTRAGIAKAKELGAQYVLKTRTDQRLYNANSLEYLFNIVKTFPAASGFKQEGRIVGVSLNSFKYRMYGLSDMTLFGHSSDIENYWNAPYDEGGKVYADMPLKINELYLATTYLKHIGRPVAWTLADSWDAFAKHFCVVDEQSLDVYWYKYSRMKEYRYRHYDKMYNDQEMSFLEWLNIYSRPNKQSLSKDLITTLIP